MNEAQFWATVDRSAGPNACWPRFTRKGTSAPTYTRATITGRFDYAHRHALALHLGRPLRARALHRCDNLPCCNPRHLFEGTQRDNMQDMHAKGRGITGRKFPGRMARGEEQGHAKLTEKDIRAIRKACAAGSPQKVVGQLFGVGQMTVSDIVRRKTWAHVT